MSPVEALLAELEARGARLRLREDGVLLAWPPKLVPPELARRLFARRAELVALLAPPSKAWADPIPPPLERPPSAPRPELEADSLAWAHLLAYASADRGDTHGLHEVVHGARCGGAKLSFTQGRWRIEPRIYPSELVSTWHDQAACESDWGRYLVPHLERLTALLRLVPSPSRLGAPPDPLTAGVEALRALGWRLGLNSEDGLTAEHPMGGAPADALWMEAHHRELAERLRKAAQPTEGQTP